MGRIKYILLFLSLCGFSASAQQFPVYDQYMMNAFLLNPAVAGHEGYTSVNLTTRVQWLGLKDAPKTYALSAQTRLLKNSFISSRASVRSRQRMKSRSGRVGLGGYLFSDQNGAFNRTGFQLTYAYHLTLSRSQLSFATSLTGFQFKINPDKIYLLDNADALYNSSRKSSFIPDANFGIYFSNRNIYAGFSVQQLFQSNFKLSDSQGIKFEMVRHYYLMAGYRFDMIDFLYIEPSFLFKSTEAFNAQGDINVKFYFKEDYWAGITYRTGGGYEVSDKSLGGKGSSIIIMGGARVDKFYFGYAFDYTLSSIQRHSIGSHELMLAVKFGDNARRYRWLNRY